MPTHLYQVGDVVSLNFDDGLFFSRLNPFTIEAQMPHVGNRLQYRIKSQSEQFRRVVPEHQINSFGEQSQTQPAIALGAGASSEHAATSTRDGTKGRL